MRILFVKERLSWPRSSGHDVHCFHLMQALASRGHDIHLAVLHKPEAHALEGVDLAGVYRLAEFENAGPIPELSKSQERFRSYWGIPIERINAVARIAESTDAEAVAVVGLNVLPYLGAVRNALRVWYAGDEWVWHHLSQTSVWKPRSWGNLKQAMVKGWYERAYARLLDRVWMVSDADRRAYRWVTGRKNAAVIPNGVDAEHYFPAEGAKLPNSCVFWGRLDFGPNIQALQWFCRGVWPRVRRKCADASFHIFGFQPSPEVRSLALPEQGIHLFADWPDIRAEIHQRQVVVLPFVSGGGIKNKLLEAAALGKAILCTPRTVSGLSAGEAVCQAPGASRFARELLALWEDAERRSRLEISARAWVVEAHTWAAAARLVEEDLTGNPVEAATA